MFTFAAEPASHAELFQSSYQSFIACHGNKDASWQLSMQSTMNTGDK